MSARLPTNPSDAVLALREATKRYDGDPAVDGVSLTVPRGELLTVVGPSGSGKSTLLRLIAGLTPLDAGEVMVAGRVVAGPRVWVPPERRHVGVVFQDHALFPHLTVAGNVAFGLQRSSTRDARVTEVLELVGLHHLARRYPHELSGGEQQRVALARALAPSPAVVLLDEPFSNIDRNLRARIREETVAVLRAAATTAVLVTHDQEEALAVGDRVAVLRAGQLEQVATPAAVFHAPSSRFVATFIGEADLVPASQRGETAHTPFGEVTAAGEPGDRMVDVMLRPHEVRISPAPDGDATVVACEFRGAFVAHRVVNHRGVAVRALTPHTDAVPVGARVRVRIAAGHPLAVFPTSAGAHAEDDPRMDRERTMVAPSSG